MFEFMQAITFYTSGPLKSTYTSSMFPFLTILALGDFWIHICTTNSANIATNIKILVNEALGFYTTLSVPYIDPYN